jgi:hypothetical protein
MLLVVGLSAFRRPENDEKDGMQLAEGDATAAKLPLAGEPDAYRSSMQEEIDKLIDAFGYSNEFAVSFSSIVHRWKDDRQQPLILMWKKALDDAKAEHEAGGSPIAQLTHVEASVAGDLREKLVREFVYDAEIEELTNAIEKKRAQCVAYSQMFYILGNSIGLNSDAIDVIEPMAGVRSAAWGHVANLVHLEHISLDSPP